MKVIIEMWLQARCKYRICRWRWLKSII